jgi:hypothetical protein
MFNPGLKSRNELFQRQQLVCNPSVFVFQFEEFERLTRRPFRLLFVFFGLFHTFQLQQNMRMCIRNSRQPERLSLPLQTVAVAFDRALFAIAQVLA